jgi:pyrimidine-specific ribonucleoside hydrolase
MGGGFTAGSAATEFNISHDPEAAAIVLEASARLGIPLTMYPLDVFHAPTITRAQAADLVCRGGRSAAELAGRLVTFQCDRFEADAATIGDAGAVCAVVDPDGLTTQQLPVRVVLTGSRGRTLADLPATVAAGAPSTPEAAATVAVAHQVDGPRCARLWLDAVR